jgi:hypothetical protein
MDKKLKPQNLKDDLWMVPCFINREGNTFQPICCPTEQETLKIDIKLPWSSEEDHALEGLTKLQGTKAWAQVAKEINKLFHASRFIRKGKQCRERFYNHINPNLKKGNWTAEEDVFILEMQQANGNKWSEIAKNLQGRNENQIKNRWKSLVSRRQSELSIEFNGFNTPLTISPPTSFIQYKADPGFSSLAGIIQAQYFAQTNDETPPFNLYFN